MMVVKKWLLCILVLTILTGCGVSSSTQYKTEGVVKAVGCDISSAYITLENGVKYKSNNQGHCRISEGVDVVIYHNEGLRISKIIVDGAEEVKE